MFLEEKNDKFKDECGVMGVYKFDNSNSAKYVYYGLYALQHRGQESGGIAINNKGKIIDYKGLNLVSEIFKEIDLANIEGSISLGHVRYSTYGDKGIINAQPITVSSKYGDMSLAYNGNIVNAGQIQADLMEEGHVFMTSSDTEVMVNLISSFNKGNIVGAIKDMSSKVRGAYALTLTIGDILIGARDPFGIRPLALGKRDDGFVLASESCAFDAIGAKFIRDIDPGEIVEIKNNKIISHKMENIPSKSARCIFEYVYFARPDSVMDGISVYESRHIAGKILAKEDYGKIEADLVIGVPDSGLAAAAGYAEVSGVPYGVGLIKNRYIGRTFIQPTQHMREEAVRIKLNPLKANIDGKSVVLVDDSIVRGTTSKRIVNILKSAGAKEVHFRVSSPPTSYSCFFGVDTPSRDSLISSYMSKEEICEFIGADSLEYLSVEGLKDSVLDYEKGFCLACFNGKYPMKVPKED